MRTPHNDQLSEPDRAGRRGQHVPERRCVITGEVSPAERLVRLALSPDGDIAPDVLGKAPGRGRGSASIVPRWKPRRRRAS